MGTGKKRSRCGSGRDDTPDARSSRAALRARAAPTPGPTRIYVAGALLVRSAAATSRHASRGSRSAHRARHRNRLLGRRAIKPTDHPPRIARRSVKRNGTIELKTRSVSHDLPTGGAVERRSATSPSGRGAQHCHWDSAMPCWLEREAALTPAPRSGRSSTGR
jgi:hypothetical protein